jgi:hypothetical protein
MARAPARCAPSVRALLRGLEEESLTALSLRWLSLRASGIHAARKKPEAITLVWMMAPEARLSPG